MVRAKRIERFSPACRAGALPECDARVMVGADGVEPPSAGCRPAVLPGLLSALDGRGGETRTRDLLLPTEAALPLAHTPFDVEPMRGIEPRFPTLGPPASPRRHMGNNKSLSPCGRGRGPSRSDGRVRGPPVRSPAPLSPMKLARMKGIEPSCIRWTGGGTPRVRHARNGGGTGNRTRGQPVKSRQLCH
jgi:hypothetical protein